MDIIKTFKPGEMVIKEGAKGTSAFVILSGTVEVIKKSGNKEIKMAILGAGQIFGEMGLIEDRPRSATVRSRSELKVRVINRERFNDLLRTRPSVLIPIMKGLFERLRQVSDILAERAKNPLTENQEEMAFEVVMEGQTLEAQKILDNRKLLITKFPFLIGRESLSQDSDVFYNNDLLIKDEKPYVVSRNHLAIINEGGQILVVDRGSAFGTIVNGNEIGAQINVFRAPLDKKENQIIIGPPTSKFIFLLNPIPA
ncbi:MAG: cyclic nucleotide-binding domain-containing protein [Thermodesulfobacteriota bacterium]|nr:cyclic nucleotide-binding domain-containing protein [Thermodesulfobacteriota bacterium]